jgi:hypothetical protein
MPKGGGEMQFLMSRELQVSFEQKPTVPEFQKTFSNSQRTTYLYSQFNLNSTCNEDNINFFRENINTELKNTQYD